MTDLKLRFRSFLEKLVHRHSDALPCAAAAAVLLGFTAGSWFGSVRFTDPLQQVLSFHTAGLLRQCLPGVPCAVVLFYFFRKYKTSFNIISGMCILAGSLCVLFPSFNTLAASLLLFALALWRCFSHVPLPEGNSRYWISVPLLLFFYVLITGFEQQFCSYNHLILLHCDWGIYFNHYRQLAENPFAGTGQWLSAGNHWNLPVNVIMAAVIGISPRAETLFAVNSLLLASAVPLGYWLCRTLRLPGSIAALCAAGIAFNPLLSNQHTTLLYGYHPVNFLLPAFFLFLIAYAKKCRWGMVFAGLFCLGTKETVFVFAAGTALLAGIRKKWKTALVSGLCSIALFCLVTQVILPRCDGTGGYFHMFQYRELGNNTLEVLLSPVLRPELFWSRLFRPGNFSFVILLLLPLVPPAFFAPQCIAAALPLLCGVLLKNAYHDKLSIVQQYGFEITIWLFTAMIYGAAAMHRKKCFSAGAAAALLAGSLAGYWFFGKTPVWGCYSMTEIRKKPDIRSIRERLKSLIPADAVVSASQTWSGQLVETHRNLIVERETSDADYRILDFEDRFVHREEMMRLCDRLRLTRKEYPVAMFNTKGCRIIVFKKGGMPWNMPFIAAGSPEKLAPRALKIRLNDPDMYAHAVYVKPTRRILIFFGVKKPCDRDADITVSLRFRGMNRYYRFGWGYGLYPAYAMTPEQSFAAELAVPASWQGVEQISIDLKTFQKYSGEKP